MYAIVTEAAVDGHQGFADHWRAVAAPAAGRGSGASSISATCWPRRADCSAIARSYIASQGIVITERPAGSAGRRVDSIGCSQREAIW
jgi:hypothetical protein